jgi:hypothetical protein
MILVKLTTSRDLSTFGFKTLRVSTLLKRLGLTPTLTLLPNCIIPLTLFTNGVRKCMVIFLERSRPYNRIFMIKKLRFLLERTLTTFTSLRKP